jgi:HemY protein
VRALFWCVVLFAAAVALALLAQYNQGSVVLVFPPWRVDVSLNFFITALVALFILLYAALRVVAITLNFPGKVRQYRERRERETAYHALKLALQAYLEGRFGRAEKFAQSVGLTDGYAALAALIAARSAHRLQVFDRRDAWLIRAAADNSVRTARLITEAELHLEANDTSAALEAIRQLHSSGARHVQAIRLEFLASQQAGLWEEVVRLSRQLDKRKAMHPAVLIKARAHAYVELLQRREGDASGLRQLWSGITTADRSLPTVAHAAAKAFTSIGEHGLAVEIVEQALNHDWQPSLAWLYGQIGTSENVSAQMQSAEAWLRDHPQDVALLVTLGKLCMRAELWGKAADYLQRSQRVETTREALLALAQLMERTGDPRRAENYYRQCACLNEPSPK